MAVDDAREPSSDRMDLDSEGENYSETDSLFGDPVGDGNEFDPRFIGENDPSSLNNERHPQSENTPMMPYYPGQQPVPANPNIQPTLPAPAPAFTLTLPTLPRVGGASASCSSAVPDPLGFSFSNQIGHTSGDYVVSTHNFFPPLSTPAVFVPQSTFDEHMDVDDAALEAEFEAAADVPQSNRAVYFDESKDEDDAAFDARVRAALAAGGFGIFEQEINSTSASSRDNTRKAATQVHNGMTNGATDNGNAQVRIRIKNGIAQDPDSSKNGTDQVPDGTKNGNAQTHGGSQTDTIQDYDGTTTQDREGTAALDIGTNDGTAQDHSGDSTTPVDNDPLTISVKDLPGYRYANSMTREKSRVPRRIDDDLKQAELLAPYITLPRDVRMEEFYKDLELDYANGKALNQDVRWYIKDSEWEKLITKRYRPDQNDRNDVTETKSQLIKLAFLVLTKEGWGERYFGANCDTASSRKRFWPADSAVILAYVVRMLYKIVYTARQTLNSRLRRDGQKTTPPSPDVTSESAQSSQFLFDLLIREAMDKKQSRSGQMNNPVLEVEIPENANLGYHIYVRRKNGGGLLSSGKYRHSDGMIAHGIFTYLKTALKMADDDPRIEIVTPHGVQSIGSDDEWGDAIWTIYNRRREGAFVEVDIFV